MFLKKIQKLKLPVILIVLSVFIFGLTCASVDHHVSMHKTSIDSVAVTHIDNQECCTINISGYIESWKNTFLMIPREIRDGLFLFISGLITVFMVSRFRPQHDLTNHYLLSYKLYHCNNLNLLFFNHLKLSFARGILNPKIY